MGRINRAEQSLSGIAVDFGGTKIAAARVIKGRVGEIHKIQTNPGAQTDALIQTLEQLIDQVGLAPEDRIGVAVTGRVHRDGVWAAVNRKMLTGFDQIPLRRRLVEKFSREVVVINDALASGLGEYVAGAGKDDHSIAFITVSTGIGGGLILDGMPITSPSGLAGHVGFTTSRMRGDACGSGRTGTIESIASGRAIAILASQAGHTDMNAKAVYEAHLAGQDWARKIIVQSATAVAELCANLKAIVDIDTVILGGSIGLADGYLALVQEALQAEPEIFRPTILPSKLGLKSALLGVLVDP